MTKNVVGVLQSALDTIDERRAVYGANEEKVGAIMEVLFPNGIQIKTAADHRMFHMVGHVVGKLTRFAASGMSHVDSMHDIIGYAALAEVEVEKHSIQPIPEPEIEPVATVSTGKPKAISVFTGKPLQARKKRV